MVRKHKKGRRRRRWLWGLLITLGLLAASAWVIYGGGEHEGPGTVTARALPTDVVADRAARQRQVAAGLGLDEAREAEILFGDLHVHTTFSADAFMRSLPLLAGEGAHPPADACDFARFCSGLDFFALTDHAEALTPRHWRETIDSIRQCNAVANDATDPDLVAFVGFEWSQVGVTPAEHYGHRNVIFRDLEDERLPTRPIGAPGMGSAFRRLQLENPMMAALIPILDFSRRQRYLDLRVFMDENAAIDACPRGVGVRDLPADCRETAETPTDLYERLAQWDLESLVIPHGTTWGFYTPPAYEWKLESDPERLRLIEVFSGHGNSEEYRDFRAAEQDADGEWVCPEPTPDFEPCCWRAGEIIRSRCGDAAPDVCEQRVREARSSYVNMGVGGHLAVPGANLDDWGSCGQCTDCFLPAFNYRPGGAAQAIVTRGDFEAEADEPTHARLGFLASSDNHTARPGTGYKELSRRRMTEAAGPESETWRQRIYGDPSAPSPTPDRFSRDELQARPGFSVLHLERQASFFLTGGLVAVHSRGRTREAIWQALEARRVYATSGPRILLWLELVNGPDGPQPMGAEVSLAGPPRFVARAVGAFEQQPGCPNWSTGALGAERLERVCASECYNPSDERIPIDRIEVVRIRPQIRADEALSELIDDPWLVLPCPTGQVSCRVEFEDPDFGAGGRSVLYYVRALQVPTPAVNAGGLRCDEDDRCEPCYGDYRTAYDEDCLSDNQERAWSSPIFVDVDPSADHLEGAVPP